MKIWYQSSAPLRYDPTFDEYCKILEEQCKRAVRTGTEVFITGTRVRVLGVDKYKSLHYIHRAQILNNMLKAETEGYDAFIIGCTYDPGLEEGREMLSIPVIGISNNAYYLAAMLGQLFAIVSISGYFCEAYRQQVNHYGLSAKCLQGNYYFPVSEEGLAMALKEPKPFVEQFKLSAQRAIADGASVIVPNPGPLATAAFRTGLTHIDGVPVVDTITAAVKMAETMVDFKKLGLEVSRALHVYGSPGKELLKKAFKEYAPVFKIDY